MPDTTPPSPDDPFADLFGKLPDPRTRTTPPAAASPDSSAGQPAQSPRPEPAQPPADVAGQPLSRRAAREAAASEPAPADPQATPSAPTEPTPAAPQPMAAQPAAALPSAAQRVSAAPVSPTATPQTAPAGSLEDLFSGATSTHEIGSPPPRPNKRKRRIGGWIALGVVLLLLGGIAAGGVYVWTTYEDKIREFMGWEEPADFEEGLANGEALVTIISGDNGRSISNTLFDAGVTKTQDAFYDYLIDEDLNPPFQPGVFSLQLEMTSPAALAAILDPANRRENSAQLREGLTVAQSLPILAESLGIPLEDFQAAVADPTVYGVPLDAEIVAAGGQPLEGWLFPATYEFDEGVTAQQVIQRIVDRTIQSLDQAGVPVEDRERILNIASIVEREARLSEDFYRVSRVIQNRLDDGMLLQMDSTSQFGFGQLGDGSVSTSNEAQFDDNAWNTYVHTGLPVGPIANPGDTAIDAAMHPTDGPWFYFVTVNQTTGETIFSTTYDEHLRGVEQFRQWCRDNPNSGC